MKLLRVTKKFDQFLDFILRFLNACDVLKGDLVLIPRQHARLRFAEIKRAFAGHADLLPEKEVENEQEKRDRDEADDSLGQDVGLSAKRKRHFGGSQFLLQIGGKIQINGRPKRDLLRRGIAHPGTRIKTADTLGWPAFLDDQSERELRVVDDLLLLKEVEEAIVGHVLLGAVAGPAPKQNRQTDQGKGDREEDDAAPVKVRIAVSLVVFLRITIWLSHREYYAWKGASAKLS